MKWMSTNKRKPDADKMVIWIRDEDEMPMWGEYRKDGKFEYVVVYESSGEEEFTDIDKYSKWLDETESIPSQEEDIEKMAEEYVKKAYLWLQQDMSEIEKLNP